MINVKRILLSTAMALFSSTTPAESALFYKSTKAEGKNIINVEEAALLGKAKLIGEPSTQGKYLKIENDGGAVFSLDVPRTGRYELHFVYRSPIGDKVQEVIIKSRNSDLVYGIGFPMTLEHNWGEIKQVVRMEAGLNTITINKKDGWIDIHYLKIGDKRNSEITPVLEPPIISPHNDIFYLNAPRDMYIHLEENGHVVKAITINSDFQLQYEVENFTTTELDNGYAENRRSLILKKKSLLKLPVGEHKILINFEDGSCEEYNLKVNRKHAASKVEIINFDVDHGNSTLVKLPNDKNLLIDSGKPEQAEKVLLPFLKKNQVKIDYYILTHFHEDHNGHLEDILSENNIDRLNKEETASLMKLDNLHRLNKLRDCQYLDNSMVLPKDELDKIWELGGVNITILNSGYNIKGKRHNDLDENNSSMSMMIEYDGFKYSHGADNYSKTQEGIMELYDDNLDFLKADYFFANHHFHGSLSTDFIKLTNPKAIFVPANGAVYARGAYSTIYVEKIEKYQKARGGKLQDTLLSCETGTVVLRINDKDDWTYETYKDIIDDYKKPVYYKQSSWHQVKF